MSSMREKLNLSNDEWVRVRQMLSGSRANSKMMAEWALSHALELIDDDSKSTEVTTKLRFDMPESSVKVYPVGFGVQSVSWGPWTQGFMNEVTATTKKIDVARKAYSLGAGREYLARKKEALRCLIRTWDAVEIPLASDADGR